MRDGIDLSKVITVMAVAFIASIGLCGLSSALPHESSMSGVIAIAGASIGVLSFLGILGVAFLWVVASIFDRGHGTNSGVQKLFNDDDRGMK
ncbi:MAG: hypothetical protein WA294_19495 [Acidobacteriaceae bacterium]